MEEIVGVVQIYGDSAVVYEEWDDGDYFEAGLFAGKGLVGGYFSAEGVINQYF